MLPAAANEKRALAAALLINDNKPRITATMQDAHTVLNGWYPKDLLIFRRYWEKGKPPSREKAQVCLEAATT